MFLQQQQKKGIRNGAVYLHSKTGFILNLKENSHDFCLTSSFLNLSHRNNLTKINQLAKSDCSNGWSVFFWIKISNLIFFDKTILKVDNLNDHSNSNRLNKNSKYFVLKLSNSDVKIQFLFKRKLWTINQNVLWKSEWTMFSLMWTEFEGLTLHLNDKKIICQQTFEYYSQREISNNLSNLFSSEDSFHSESGNIYIGFNNKQNNSNKKLFSNIFKDEFSNYQNSLLASSFNEAILIDELNIKDYKISAKEILQNYLREYSIQNEFDSVEEKMYLTSIDNKQSEIIPTRGALTKKIKDDWYLNLNGDNQIVIMPNLFDICVQDIENLCSFGFTINLWFKLTFNFIHHPSLDKNSLEQVLFYFGSQDFKNGLDGRIIIHSKTKNEKTTYKYSLIINYKTSNYILTKSYKFYIKNITLLNELNCLTVQFSDGKHLKESLKINWLSIELIEKDTTVQMLDHKTSIQLSDYIFKTSTSSSSNSIGLFGDTNRKSYFSIQKFYLKNYETSFDEIEYDFKSSNPTVYEFNTLEMPNLSVTGMPQQVETIFGKSLLFSRNDQRLTIKDTTNSCFGNLDLCKNGYTIKIVTCFTNNNLMKISQIKSGFSTQFNLTKNLTKKIYLLQNGNANTRQGLIIYYDVTKSQLITIAKTSSKWYKSEIGFKLKLYAWYTITMSLDQSDGLRLYINNKLVDHSFGMSYSKKFDINNEQHYEFNLGKSDLEFDEFLNDETINLINIDNLETNQNEDKEKISKNFIYNKKLSSFNSNYYYEFILHKIVQYDVRKYPDEIITKNFVYQEKRIEKHTIEHNWIMTVVSSSLLSFAIISIAILAAILKRHTTTNGFWSRENEMFNKKQTKRNKLFRFLGFNDQNEEIDSTIYSNLELKQCHLNKDVNCLLFNSGTSDRLIVDEYSNTNSLFGTIDRLIKNQNGTGICSSSSESSSSSSSSSTTSATNNSSQTTFCSSSNNLSSKTTSASYIVNQQDESFEKSEIHF